MWLPFASVLDVSISPNVGRFVIKQDADFEMNPLLTGGESKQLVCPFVPDVAGYPGIHTPAETNTYAAVFRPKEG